MDPIVEVLESAMAAQDPYTVTHQQRVAQISLVIAREMGLEEQKISNLEMAARLHDFGKISVHWYLIKAGEIVSPRNGHD
jgi:HD-GYP domain-containing protein (c-di-GMP phosphodiesterase class II)